jgi:hypothetical protein
MRTKKTSEDELRSLFSKHTFPPVEVIIPILEKTGQGEQKLANQIYDTYVHLALEIRKILGLEERNMKTLAKVWGIITSFEGMSIQPIELNDSKYSFSLVDCPMAHVGKNIPLNVKSKFCDLVCTSASKALMDSLLGSDKAEVTWDKALIKGARKCTVAFESVKDI